VCVYETEMSAINQSVAALDRVLLAYSLGLISLISDLGEPSRGQTCWRGKRHPPLFNLLDP
jgi:hypothetical protein